MKTAYRMIMILALGLILIGCNDSDSDDDRAKLRVLHLSYDAPTVDVLVDGHPEIEGLSYSENSGYTRLDEGEYRVQVVAENTQGPAVIDEVLPLEEKRSYSVLAIDTLNQITPLFITNGHTPNENKAIVRFVHASPDAPAVDIRLNTGGGPVVFGNTAFGETTDYLEVDEADYTFVVTPSGNNTEVKKYSPITLGKGNMYTIIAFGTLDGADNIPFRVRAYLDTGSGNNYSELTDARVLVTHASPDAPAVDFLVDDVLEGTGLEFTGNTGYLPILSGTRDVKIRLTGTSTVALNMDLVGIEPFNSYSVFVYDRAATLDLLQLEDDLTPPFAGKSHIRFVHLSPNAPPVDIAVENGIVLFPDVSFGNSDNFGLFTEVDAGTYNLEVRLAGTTDVVLSLPDITLESGSIYTVFANGLVAGSPELGATIIVNNP